MANKKATTKATSAKKPATKAKATKAKASTPEVTAVVSSGPAESAFAKRMREIGYDPDKHFVFHEPAPGQVPPQVDKVPCFREDKHGNICITLYDINRHAYTVDPRDLRGGKKSKSAHTHRNEIIYRKRHTDIPALAELLGKPVDKIGKYANAYGDKIMVDGLSVYGYVPLNLIEAYHKKQKIDHLIITEGEFKAFVGAEQGLYVYAIPGIKVWRTKKKKTGTDEFDMEQDKIFWDLDQIIQTCKPDTITLLHDKDCRIVEWKEGVDLAKRARDFYRSVEIFMQLCTKYDADLYFAHIREDCKHKGLDDLLIGESNISKIRQELTHEGMDRQYIHRMAITTKNVIWKYFFISDAEGMYEHNAHRIDDRPFVWNYKKYAWSNEENKLEELMDADFAQYFYLGNHVYKKGPMPRGDRYEYTTTKLNADRLLADFNMSTKRVIQCKKAIPKYDGEVNLPSHLDYQEQRTITDAEGNKMMWRNAYNRLSWNPTPGTHVASCMSADQITEDKMLLDIPVTVMFMKHIWGLREYYYEQRIPNPNYGKLGGQEPRHLTRELMIPRYLLGFDYLTILWRFPMQILPIVVLGSREQQTGKTKFVDWLRLIFQQNVSKVNAEALSGQFTGQFATSLLAVIEEALVEKKANWEKIKALCTDAFAKLEKKGRDAQEIYSYLKIIMTTNNMTKALPLDKKETRAWVLEVPRVENTDPHLIDKLEAEIPQLLYYLTHRKLLTRNETRAWFRTDLIDSEALQTMKASSKTGAERLIEEYLRDHFRLTMQPKLQFSARDLMKAIDDKRLNLTYVKDTVEREFSKKLGSNNFYYLYTATISQTSDIDNDDLDDLDAQTLVTINKERHKTGTYTFYMHDVYTAEELISFADVSLLIQLEAILRKRYQAMPDTVGIYKEIDNDLLLSSYKKYPPKQGSLSQLMHLYRAELVSRKKSDDTYATPEVYFQQLFQKYTSITQLVTDKTLSLLIDNHEAETADRTNDPFYKSKS